MKTHLCSSGRVVAFALAAAVGLVAPQATTPAPADLLFLTHARIAVHRDANGNLMRGVSNQIETENWSGYALANFETDPGSLYTAAQATWTVPKVSYAAPPPVCHTIRLGSRSSQFCSSSNPQWEYSSSWVGIGGYCENANCTIADNTLIQLGTTQAVSLTGSTEYYAWIEMLPNNPIIISSNPSCDSLSCAYPVHPGDNINASLWCTANCTSGSASQTWTLYMLNETEKWTFSTNVTYASSLLSADWILEAPSSAAGVLPLADYGSTSFASTIIASCSASPCAPTTTSLPPSFTDPNFGVTNNTDAIVMVDPYGETSNPTVPGSDPFYTCWGNNPNSIETCVP